MTAYKKLKDNFSKLSHLHYIQRILMWDEAVIMPEGAGYYRAESVATFNQMMQKLIISKKIPALIAAANLEEISSPWDAANLAWMKKKYIVSKCIPSKLTAKSTKSILTSFQAWRRLREQNNWHEFMPCLKKTFQCVREIAERKSQALQLLPYDVLMDDFSPGLTQAKADAIFSVLKENIPVLRHQIIKKQGDERAVALTGPFPMEKQNELGLLLMRAMGFNFNHGRLDISHHPFCDGIPADIRITTHYNEHDLLSSLFGIIHETGHALYEQGMPQEWMFQPVGQTQSKDLHESQSLLFEYEVCHSHDFLEYFSKKINLIFGSNEAFSSDNLHKLITSVKTNLIRIYADEVSYPLHVVLRYEIEKKLFLGEISIEDLPSIWDEQMLKYFDISTEGDYKNGVMQDMHWSWGYFGYFPSYTFGQLMASQLYNVFSKVNEGFNAELREGNFSLLQKWLKKNVYSYASSISSDKLLLTVTGESLNPSYFLERIRARYLS